MSQNQTKSLRQWIFDCPCVIDGRVIVDVRGAWPIAIIGLASAQIESRNDFVFFVSDYLRDTYTRQTIAQVVPSYRSFMSADSIADQPVVNQ